MMKTEAKGKEDKVEAQGDGEWEPEEWGTGEKGESQEKGAEWSKRWNELMKKRKRLRGDVEEERGTRAWERKNHKEQKDSRCLLNYGPRISSSSPYYVGCSVLCPVSGV
jgi:hypothetical protein